MHPRRATRAKKSIGSRISKGLYFTPRTRVESAVVPPSAPSFLPTSANPSYCESSIPALSRVTSTFSPSLSPSVAWSSLSGPPSAFVYEKEILQPVNRQVISSAATAAAATFSPPLAPQAPIPFQYPMYHLPMQTPFVMPAPSLVDRLTRPQRTQSNTMHVEPTTDAQEEDEAPTQRKASSSSKLSAEEKQRRTNKWEFMKDWMLLVVVSLFIFPDIFEEKLTLIQREAIAKKRPLPGSEEAPKNK